MLLDPSDEQTVPGLLPFDPERIPWAPKVKPIDFGQKVEFYREICDPVQANANSYELDGFKGVGLSDFVTPAFYQADATGPFDVQVKVTRPLECLDGGFLS
jgi:hypothetical protein